MRKSGLTLIVQQGEERRAAAPGQAARMLEREDRRVGQKAETLEMAGRTARISEREMGMARTLEGEGRRIPREIGPLSRGSQMRTWRTSPAADGAAGGKSRRTERMSSDL